MNDLNKLFSKLFGDNPLERLNEDGIINTDTNKLGEPTKVDKYTENGIEYIKSVWETEEGIITKIESYQTYDDVGLSPDDYTEGDIIYQTMSKNMTDWLNSFGFTFHEYDRPITDEEKIDLLETKLQYCVDNENYERAARLRDEIKILKNT
jgi:protein-arginine kinase activator protein McsA